MPYSKEHKNRTRNRILSSAYALFSNKGFDGVTVDDVMLHCSLTRGAFYAHFDSKADLYGEALAVATTNSMLADSKPSDTSSQQWLGQLLDGYLSAEHVNGRRPCPLAFLSTDIVSRDGSARRTYAQAYINMNKIIIGYAGTDNIREENDVFSLTSMIIGAVAVSRTIDDAKLVEDILTACRNQARLLLGGV